MDSDIGTHTKRRRLLLAADAFLFAAALDITVTALVLAVMSIVGGGPVPIDELFGPVLGGAVLFVMTALPIAGGAVLAWRMHGNALDGASTAGMALGLLIGGPLAMGVLVGASLLASLIPGDREQPPWLLIGVLAALVVLILSAPVVDAVRDARLRPPAHRALDITRFVALALVVVLAAIVLPAIGAAQNSELAEAGIFMVPFAAGAALATLGADFASSRRATHGKHPGDRPIPA